MKSIRKFIRKITTKQDPVKKYLFELKQKYPELVILLRQNCADGAWHLAVEGPACSFSLCSTRKPSYLTIYHLSHTACGGAS